MASFMRKIIFALLFLKTMLCFSQNKVSNGASLPLVLSPETFYYNTSGLPQSGGTYNVLANDSRVVCTNNVSTQVPLANISLTGSESAPYSYFTVLPNGSIFVDADAGPAQGTIIPGTYPLTYQVCDLINPGNCITQTVLIYVSGSAKMATVLPKQIKKEQRKTTTQNIYQIITFPDANLKAKLLEANDSNNIAYNLDNTNIVAVDTNVDGEIDTNEALQIGRLFLVNSNITDLTGLEYFTNLRSFNIGLNNVTNFDIPLPNLSILVLYQNPLTNINTSILPSLSGVNCSNTLMTSLNTTNKYLLNNVNIAGSQISNIDLGVARNLIYFYCKNNPNLTSINIKNTSLLDYSNPAMQQDCWTNCPNLNNICADSNEIAVLQSFLSGCGVNTSGIDINSNCALGVDENELLNGISITPNPSSGVFEITFANGLPGQVTALVYNVLGQELLTVDCHQQGSTTIDLSGYAGSVYVLQLTMGEHRLTKRIVKE